MSLPRASQRDPAVVQASGSCATRGEATLARSAVARIYRYKARKYGCALGSNKRY